MEDVARVAAVSTATVSRVLNSPDLVAPETAARVQRVIEELGYKPNVFAQGLMTRKSRLLGLLLPDIHGEFYSELLRGADAEARRQGYHLLVGSEGRDGDTPMFSSTVVGFLGGIAMMLSEPNEALANGARQANLPLVVIDDDFAGSHVDRVLVDNAVGTREAVEHLLTSVPAGRCWFVGGPKENYDTADRAKAFLHTLEAHGVKNGERGCVRYGDYSVEWGQKAGGELFRSLAGGATGASGTGAMGVLAANDEIAYGVMLAAMDAGLDVPKDVRLIGFDDTRLASLVRPQISSVRVPMSDVGTEAVKLLVERLGTPERGGHTVRLATKLVVRASSKV
jgi:LacI family transcriptional regulator